jgi:uncharacterized protein (TIGR00369 family)
MNPEALFWKVVSGAFPLPNAAKMLGWKFLSYDAENSEAKIEFDASAALTNPMGNIQGGMLSAMLDDCMGPALYACLAANQTAVTLESKTSYLNPASPGTIFGQGRIEHLKGGICFTSGQLSNEAGEILATATATYRISKLNIATAKERGSAA